MRRREITMTVDDAELLFLPEAPPVPTIPNALSVKTAGAMAAPKALATEPIRKKGHSVWFYACACAAVFGGLGVLGGFGYLNARATVNESDPVADAPAHAPRGVADHSEVHVPQSPSSAMPNLEARKRDGTEEADKTVTFIAQRRIATHELPAAVAPNAVPRPLSEPARRRPQATAAARSVAAPVQPLPATATREKEKKNDRAAAAPAAAELDHSHQAAQAASRAISDSL
jgi:hypothetical protein